MDLFIGRNQERIHTTLDHVDFKYCKENNLKFAHLLRAAIRDHRLHSGDLDVAPSARELIKERDNIKNHRDRILEVLRKILSKEQFDDFFDKLGKA